MPPAIRVSGPADKPSSGTALLSPSTPTLQHSDSPKITLPALKALRPEGQTASVASSTNSRFSTSTSGETANGSESMERSDGSSDRQPQPSRREEGLDMESALNDLEQELGGGYGLLSGVGGR